MNSDDTLYGQIRNGVLTLSGNVSKITVSGGCLCISDGFVGQVAELRLRRADCPVRRIVVTRPDGFISFAAVKWLHGVGASLVQLDWDGTVLLATMPESAGDFPTLRRAQALATGSPAGLEIGRRILHSKVIGQAVTLDLMRMGDAARLLEKLAAELLSAETEVQLLAIEAIAATAYWRAWNPIPMRFARQSTVPSHWATFGTRHSITTNSPRKATTPGNALLNYLYGLIVGEMTIALTAVGLDPGIGIFHTDKRSRQSLAYDMIEAVRPQGDFWLASWLREARFSKRDFFEEPDGTIRITRPLTSHLAMTKRLWQEPCSLAASWLVQALGKKVGECPLMPGPVSRPTKFPSNRQRAAPKTCHECGGLLPESPQKFCSDSCMVSFHTASATRTQQVVAGLAIARARGTDPAHGGEHSRRRIETLKVASAARRAWEARSGWTEAKDREARQWFATTVSPLLANCRNIEIRRACDCSTMYARKIRDGLIPHPMHYAKLATLVGVPITETNLVNLPLSEQQPAAAAPYNSGSRGSQADALDQHRRWYTAEVQPRLARLQPREIVHAIGTSARYARQIVAGTIPHPRHFAALAMLVGLQPDRVHSRPELS